MASLWVGIGGSIINQKVTVGNSDIINDCLKRCFLCASHFSNITATKTNNSFFLGIWSMNEYST